MANSNTMVFVNTSEHTLKLDAIGFDEVGPGEEIELPLALCAPGRTDNGGRSKSTVEQVAPQLKPKSESDHKAWMAVPVPPTPVSKVVTVSARPLQESPGVKALREKKELEEEKAKAAAVALSAKTSK